MKIKGIHSQQFRRAMICPPYTNKGCIDIAIQTKLIREKKKELND